jgi:hypothetical protein
MVVRRKTKPWKSAAARRLLRLAGDASTIEEAVEIIANTALKDVPYPPVRLEGLFSKFNISGVKAEDDLPYSGELRPENGSFVIVCSTHLSTTRRRFTIAHEIAHAIFELSGPNCPRSGRELERLCDRVATELLMPRAEFIARAGKSPGIDEVFHLARDFQTSLMTTAIRCNEFFKLSIFVAEASSVLWGSGAIKKGSTRYLDSALQQLIREAETTPEGSAVLPLEIQGILRSWSVQYRNIGKKQTLFVLHPSLNCEAGKSIDGGTWPSPTLIR